MLPPFLPFWTIPRSFSWECGKIASIMMIEWKNLNYIIIILISGGSISSLLHGCFVHNPSLYAVLHWCMGRYFWPKETHVHLPNSKLTWKQKYSWRDSAWSLSSPCSASSQPTLRTTEKCTLSPYFWFIQKEKLNIFCRI